MVSNAFLQSEISTSVPTEMIKPELGNANCNGVIPWPRASEEGKPTENMDLLRLQRASNPPVDE